MKNIQLQVQEDGVGVASLDMPGRPFNVFSEDMMADLAELIDYASENLQGLVITSGKSAFVAGADLGMIKSFADMRFHAGAVEMKQRFSNLGRIFRRLERLPIPVVAAINGLALGGGLEVALACHGRVCVDIPAPILGLPEIQLGLLPGAGGTQRLPRYIGLQAATRMLLDGAPITPAEALQYGLLDGVCQPQDLIEEALGLVRTMTPGARWDRDDWRVAEQDIALVQSPGWQDEALHLGGWSERCHDLYPAVDAIVRCLGEGLVLGIDDGCEREWDIFVELMSDPVVANMVVTCFLNKTAAPKRALQASGAADKVSSCSWQSRQPLPKGLARKVQMVDPELADVIVVDADDRNGAANEIVLSDACGAGQAQAGSGQLVLFAAQLAAVEALEIPQQGDALIGRAVAIANAMGKIPVLVNGGGGVLSAMLNSLVSGRENAVDKDEYLAGLASVELLQSMQLLDPALDTAAPRNSSARARSAGLNALLEMSVAAYDCLQSGVIDDAEMLDVLAVYGIHFPKWTGGPIALLAMAQRAEVDVGSLREELRKKVEAIELPLKNWAAYNSPALAVSG
ncbi:MAG: hypothetical protein GYB33_06440 [Gammaproteobacteria bacterium]|nr:hypothetical protein [Gammaproteobacteria bacterium]